MLFDESVLLIGKLFNGENVANFLIASCSSKTEIQNRFKQMHDFWHCDWVLKVN